MKLLSIRQRIYWKRVKYKRDRRRNKRSRRERIRCIHRKCHNTIQAPMLFDIDQPTNRKHLLDFLAALRSKVTNGHCSDIKIDFFETKKMWAAGTLLFKAEVYRLKQIVDGEIKFSCIPPRKNKVAQVLKQTGIYKLLGHKTKIIPTSDDVVYWRHAHGNHVEGVKYDEVLGRYDGVIPNVVASGLYLGLTEAMTNCHHHAYIASRQDGLGQTNEPKNWWMFSQERDGELSVVFCDLGVGIPETLPLKQPKLWAKLKNAFGFLPPPDAEAISEAIVESRSRTTKHYRGKGLRQLVDVIEKTPQAKLLLHSNRGKYTFINGESKLHNYDDSIMGTLIAWTVPIKSKVEREDEKNN